MGTILVIDDDARTRELMEAFLRRGRHRVLSAADCAAALEVAERELPDLALVDLDIPGAGGLQTMRLLKRQRSTEYVPIILVAPFTDLPTRLGAWQAGADEVLTKPLHRDELLVRIDNLLALRSERIEVARRGAELQRLQEFKTNLDQLLVHDLKNPLSALSANLEYLLSELAAGGKVDQLDAVRDALGASRRLHRMVSSILDASAFEEAALTLQRSAVVLRPLLAGLQRLHRHAADDRNVEIAVECQAELGIVADLELITRVVENLVEFVLRRTGRGGRITLRAESDGARTRVHVVCTGQPIPADMRARLFEKYGPLETHGHPRLGLGLGLYFCRLAVEAHGGRVFIAEDVPFGLVVELPAAAAPAAVAR